MSICDLIVVMKDGMLQQIDMPQKVYDDPENLFVAKFLGTPPINVFRGSVKNGQLYIGEAAVMEVGAADMEEVTVAIRPEGFIPCQDGVLTCELKRIEVMGRDTSMVCDHSAFTGEAFRAIVDSQDVNVSGGKVSFRLRPAKVLLFNAEDGSRIRF